MKALIEIHMLQNFAPSNLNRDDTGSPKDAYFGGVKRGRVSSQSFKRAIRMYFKDQKLVKPEYLSTRTKRFLDKLSNRLEKSGKSKEEASLVVSNAITSMGTQKQFKFDKKRPELTEYLFPLGEKEIDKLVKIMLDNWETLNQKKFKFSKDLKKELETSLDGGQAIDIALFGRMLANLPEASQDAACQVAHAISTHKINYDEDFFTAVDDLKPDDNAGADMLGTVEFNSACYYRYAVIDLNQLSTNLLGEGELVKNGIAAFIKACIYAIPTGKQNSFAAHQLPSFIGVSIRKDASPRSLANAFEKPVRSQEGGYLEKSSERIIKEWNELEEIFAQGGVHYVINRTEAVLNGVLEQAKVKSVEDLIKNISMQLEQLLQ